MSVSWMAAVATIVGASLTAANANARVTGYGFVAFTAGSVLWVTHGVTTDQPSLLWANAFLLVINAIGVWRWLFTRARQEKGAKMASVASIYADAPTVRPATGVIGARIVDETGDDVGPIVDFLMRCEDHGPAYYVVKSARGLVPVKASEICMASDSVKLAIPREQLDQRDTLEQDRWPATVSAAR